MLCVSWIGLVFDQSDVICILNSDVMTINSHYCESRWYLVLGGDALVSPLYNRALHVLINRCKLTGPSFPTYMDMAGTLILSHPCQLGSSFNGGAHDIKELPWCNNGWTEIFVVVTGMVLSPIIPEVSMSWPPKLLELPLAVPASEPVKLHVDWFGGNGEDFIIYEAVFCFVVRLGGRLWWRMDQLFKSLAHGNCCFGIQTNATSSASTADNITLRVVLDRLRMAPLFGGFSLSLDRKLWPPERLWEFFSEN